MKYLIIVFLSLTVLHAQDTLNTKPVYKNALGISLNQAITGILISNDPYFKYDPIFASSYYVEYMRLFHKRFWLNAGIGIFNTGYRMTYPDYTYNFNDYNLAIHLKPKIILVNTNRIIFYAGLSGQFNLYLTTFTLSAEGENQTLSIFDSKRELKRDASMPIANVYAGFISGIGIKLGSRVMIIAEPEFKLNMNAVARAQYYYNTYSSFIPYAVGINLKGFIRFN